jgi:hypothetical protein
MKGEETMTMLIIYLWILCGIIDHIICRKRKVAEKLSNNNIFNPEFFYSIMFIVSLIFGPLLIAGRLLSFIVSIFIPTEEES